MKVNLNSRRYIQTVFCFFFCGEVRCFVADPAFLFPFPYSCHEFCIGRRLGPHVLVLGQVYEDAEDAGGDVEGQGEAGPLLGPLGHLGGRAKGSFRPDDGVTLLSLEQRVQHRAESQRVLLDGPLQSGHSRTGPLALDEARQQQSQVETCTSHGDVCEGKIATHQPVPSMVH